MGAPTTVPATRPVAEAGKISIHLNNVHPKLVMGELANQAGIRFHPSPAGLWEGKEWPAVLIDFQEVSVWKAVKEISQKTGLYIQRGVAGRSFFVESVTGVGKLR